MTLKNTRYWVLLAACAAAPAFAQNIAVVNGTPIPKSRADALVQQLVAQGQQDSPHLEQAVREELINREILMQEAARRGLPSRPDVKAQVAVAQQTVVLRALIEDFVKTNQPSDAEVKAKYDELVKEAGGGKEYHLHHILVENEQQAKDLIAKIKGGASFEDLAKQYSKDPGSAAHGGDLGFAPASTYVKEFGDALAKLKKGEYTQTPVKTQFGYHVIRLDDVRDAKVPTFDEAKPQIVNAMESNQQWQQQRFQQMLKDLHAKAKIE
jgi:peptidyl-prolyl cis-trans isomerase C